jgi:hypothetical protein
LLPTARALGFVLAVAWLLSAAPVPAQEKKEDPKKKEDAKPLAVKSTDLAKQYRTGEEAADKKYKGKQLLITGKVFDVTAKEGILTLEGYTPKGEPPTLIQFYFEGGQKAVGKTKPGDEVKIQGTCEGRPSKFAVIVKKAEFVK